MILLSSVNRLFVTILFALIVAIVTTLVLSQSLPSTSESAVENPVAETPSSVADNATLNLHRWGAVTLFHGLPSDRVNAIAEDASGALWFGTDSGLVRYDGRRTQLFTAAMLSQTEEASELPSPRIYALKLDAVGGLWIGTDAGAARLFNNRLEAVADTTGRAVRSIAESGNREIALVTDRGEVLRYATTRTTAPGDDAVKRSTPYADPNFGSTVAQKLSPASHALLSIQAENSMEQRPLELTAIASAATGDWWIGSQRRGALIQQGNELREALLKSPRPFFVEAIFAASKQLWVGAQAGDEGEGVWVTRNNALEKFPLNTGTVTAIHGSDDEVWIGTDKRGAFLLRNEQVIEHLTFENTAGGLRSNHINAIYRDHEGIVWFGTDRGVCRYDRDSFRATNVGAGAESNFIRSMLVTKDGETLAGSNRGLFTLARDAGISTWSPVAAVQDRPVYSMLEDNNSAVWVGTNDGLFVRRKSGGEFLSFENPQVSFDRNQEVVNENQPGANLKSDKTETTNSEASPPIANSSIRSPQSAVRNQSSVRALASFRGQIYALVYGRGLERIEGSKKFNVLNDQLAQRALCLAVEPGKDGKPDAALWFGTTEGEWFSFDGATVTSRTVGGLASSSTAIRAIAFAAGQTWLGTSTGLYRIVDKQAERVIADADVYSLTTVREQNVPEALAQSALGRLVLGRDANASQEAAQKAGFADSPENSAGRELIWCGTRNAGAYKMLVRDRVMIRFDTEQGLPSPQVFAVAANQSGERVWIGTSRGVVLHQPSAVAPRIEARRFVADRVYAPEYLAGEISLEHTQKSILLEVAALGSRTFPGQFQYEFTLRDRLGEPLRTVLSPDSQFAIEKNMRGPYSLWVRAISRDLVYSAPLKVRYRVTNPPFPRTTVMLAVLLVAAVAAAAYAFRQNRRIARANRQLEETNEELHETRLRLAKETESERARIARDLHDQTLADLRHLLVLTDQMEKEITDPRPQTTDLRLKDIEQKKQSVENKSQVPVPATLRREIENISNEIRHICEDLSPSVLENIGFLPALEWALSDAVAHLPVEEKFTYEFLCEPELEDRLELSEIERIQLYRIVQEAINNICRHARAKRVRFEVRSIPVEKQGDADTISLDDLLLMITDDGIGFDGSSSVTGHGIANIKSRANLIAAEIHWHTPEHESGSQIEIRKTVCVRR